MKRLGSWYNSISKYISQEYFNTLGCTIANLRKSKTIYPVSEDVFKIFQLLKYEDVKVVMCFQDPYYQDIGTGIATAIKEDELNIPKTLQFMINELERNLGILILDFDSSLLPWVEQGVMMLNVALTVEKGQPLSHTKLWYGFTEAVFKALNERDKLVFALFGKEAKQFKHLISDKHKVLEYYHPVQEAYGGIGINGSNVFNEINNNLTNKIRWI